MTTAAMAAIKPTKAKRSWLPANPKVRTGLIIVTLIVLFAIFAPLFVGSPDATSDDLRMSPLDHPPLGTTQTGQDVFAQLAWASRGSLTIGLIVGLVTLVLSTIFGIFTTYAGGVWDDVFALFTNVWLIIPGLPLIIIISSYIPQKGAVLIALVLALTSWAAAARVLRSVTLSARRRDYILASRVSGERTWRTVIIELMPNLIPMMASMFVFGILGGILGEAGLAFLGLGATDTWTWGTMLYFAQNGLALRLGMWWWFIPPGAMIALFGMGLSLINFGIDEIINPKLRNTNKEATERYEKAQEEARIALANEGSPA